MSACDAAIAESFCGESLDRFAFARNDEVAPSIDMPITCRVRDRLGI